MVERADVVVIGAGAAGEVCAGRARRGGGRVVLMESALAGGECSYWACMPSKALLGSGAALAAASRVPGLAGALAGARVDPAATFAFRDEVTHGWDDGSQVEWIDGVGAELVRGRGRLDGPRRVVVTAGDGAEQVWEAGAVVLATGSSAVVPPVPGLAEAEPWTSREATSATRVPARLAVLGGGPVACELAQAFAWLGASEVTLVQRGDRLLARAEPFASAELAEGLRASGVDVRLGVEATEVVAGGAPGGGHVLRLSDGGEVAADTILVATGRRPNTAGLGLETVGLDPRAPLVTDDRLRVRGVDGWLYAVGDVNGRSPLTHMGKYQARVAGDHLAGDASAADRADDGIVPAVVFTDPQVASVGLTEAEAAARGLRCRVARVSLADVAGVYLRGPSARGTAQLVVDEDARVAVGATFTGPEVADLLHAATVAIAGRVPLSDLAHAVPAYPTPSEVWLRLLEADG